MGAEPIRGVMLHTFEETSNKWFNSYEVLGAVGIDHRKGSVGRIYYQDKPLPSAAFLIEYRGVSRRYYGYIISDGVRYAYVNEDSYIMECLVEPRLNLYCRTLIRRAIKKYIDSLELWPIDDTDNSKL